MREDPPQPMARSLRRYLPAVALPPCRYLPGVTPRPRRDPRGHAIDGDASRLTYVPAADWRRHRAYLLGVDLFNFAYWWEAHETWESAWHASTHDSLQHDFLKGLIQAAGALLKRHVSGGIMGPSLATSAVKVLRRVAETTGGRYMGLDLAAWLPAFEQFFARRADDAALFEIVLSLAIDEGPR